MLEELQKPFPEEDIEWRIQSAGVTTSGKAWGKVLAYVTNRAIQKRLDEVCGVLGWKNEYDKSPDGGVLCGISIYDENRKEWVTKYDGAENTAVESIKGGLSAAMKRSGAQWGIGRYLYKLDVTFVSMTEQKPTEFSGWNSHYDKKTNKTFYWQYPNLPKWALPEFPNEKGEQ